MSDSLYAIGQQAAANAGVPWDLFQQQINIESGWNPNAVSASGALGIAQILPSTAANPGFGLSSVDPTDPTQSLNFAAQYDAALYGATGSWGSALEAYNTGVGNVLSGNTSGVSSAYASLAATADQEYGAGIDPNDLTGGGNAGLAAESLLGIMPSSTAQAGATPGQQAVNNAPGWVSQIETWIGSKALNVGTVVIGLIFLVVGLYLLGGGKPSDLVAVAAA